METRSGFSRIFRGTAAPTRPMKCLFTGQIADIYASSPLLCQICAADGALPHAERHVAAPCAKGNGEGRNHTNPTTSACDRTTIYTPTISHRSARRARRPGDCDIALRALPRASRAVDDHSYTPGSAKQDETVHYLRLLGTTGVVRPGTYARPDNLHAPELTRSQTRNI